MKNALTFDANLIYLITSDFRGSYGYGGGGCCCCSKKGNLLPMLAALAAAVFFIQQILMMGGRRKRRKKRQTYPDEFLSDLNRNCKYCMT